MRARPAVGGGPAFRAVLLAIASLGAAGGYGVLSLDADEWVRWLTSGGEVTSSRRERVAIARALVAAAACIAAALGLAGALVPEWAFTAYTRSQRALREAVAGRRRSHALGRVVAVSLLAIVALLGLAYAVHRLTGTPLVDLYRDPASVVGAPPWVGLLSNVGILIWTSAAATCFLGAVLLGDRNAPSGRVGLLWASGALTTLLVLDDLFLLHEGLLPRLTGLPEMVFVAAYPVLFTVYLVRHGAAILAADWPLLVAAVAFLAASMGLDTVIAGSRFVFLEDASKLAGIVLWLAFFVRTVREALLPA